MAWDLRKQKSVFTMKEEKVKGVTSSVISIHPLRDDNYYISSAFNSKVGDVLPAARSGSMQQCT